MTDIAKGGAAISEKRYVLGRRETESRGILNIGRYYALDGSLGSPVYVDGLRPHVILTCGKRGYGKSYTMGTLVEEMALLEDEVRRNIGVVIIDTLGIFWTLATPNRKQEDALDRWGLNPRGFDIVVFSSEENCREYEKDGIPARTFLLKTSELETHHWSQLFNLSPTDYVSAAIGRAVHACEEQGEYAIDDLITHLQKDTHLRDDVRAVAENFLHMAKSWRIFDTEGVPVEEIVRGGSITVLDISPYPEELKIVIVALLARRIFEGRIRERKRYERAVMEHSPLDEGGIPLTWMAIDEAHVFLPEESCLSKEPLIKQWMRQGRQPGVSLLLATQRPSSLDQEVLSHSDIIICHRLTAQEDIAALNRVRPTYMAGEIGDSLKKIGTEKGVALIIDDTSEAVHVIKIRPRMSWHGGEEPSALMEQ